MNIARDLGVISGFRIQEPIAGWPVLMHCGEAHCSRSHSPGEDTHPVFEFTYLAQGDLMIDTDRFPVHLSAGDMFIAHPNQPHSWKGNNHPPFHQFWLAVQVDALGNAGVVLDQLLRTTHCQVIRQCNEVETVLRGMVRWLLGGRPSPKDVTTAYLNLFVELLCTRLGETSRIAGEAPPIPYSYEVQKAVRYLQENLRRRVTLEELSHISGYTPPHICRLFHREVGMAPLAYQLGLRLEAAKEALLGAHATIAEVAKDFGFSSSQYFSTRFARQFSITPRKWQLSQRTEVPVEV